MPVSYLVGEPERTLALNAVAFRSKAIAGRREQMRVEAQVLRPLERYAAVEDLLRLPVAAWKEWDKPDGTPFPVTHIVDAERGAWALRGPLPVCYMVGRGR